MKGNSGLALIAIFNLDVFSVLLWYIAVFWVSVFALVILFGGLFVCLFFVSVHNRLNVEINNKKINKKKGQLRQ